MDEMRRRVGVAAGVVPRNTPTRRMGDPTTGEGATNGNLRSREAANTLSASEGGAGGSEETATRAASDPLAAVEETPTEVPPGEGLLAGWSTVEEGRRRVDERTAFRMQVDLYLPSSV
jgi:hypothetical protein